MEAFVDEIAVGRGIAEAAGDEAHVVLEQGDVAPGRLRFEPRKARAESALDASEPKEPAGLGDAAAPLRGELDDDPAGLAIVALGDEPMSHHAEDHLPDGLS